jgi:hypothetical protein
MCPDGLDRQVGEKDPLFSLWFGRPWTGILFSLSFFLSLFPMPPANMHKKSQLQATNNHKILPIPTVL